MTLIVLTQASASAPACEGVNGSMNAVIHFCVTHASLGAAAWVRDYNDAASNTSIWRPASGNRFSLYCRHNSAVSGSALRATVRGCESASAYNVRVDEFPTAAQVTDANSNWVASSTADGTDRNWTAIVSGTFILLFTRYDAAQWETHFFGDVPGGESGDVYDTACIVRGGVSAAAAVSVSAIQNNAFSGTSALVYWTRDISGAIKSSRGFVSCLGTSLGLVTGTPAMKGGYDNRIRREKIALGCIGSASATAGVMTMARRGWLPNVWQPLHNGNGGVADQDTGADTAYSASALFRIYFANSGGSSFLIVEESDTWAAPSG